MEQNIISDYIISQYKNIKSSSIDKLIGLDEALSMIKNGDENIVNIKRAREVLKGSEEYDNIKSKLLPTFRFNFMFDDKASNANITVPTGLIYIDADNIEQIPDSEYVYSKWKSLSNTGYGILVKVENLNLLNFKDCYYTISKLFGIKTDLNAAKATQQTVLSLDSNLFTNPNSLVFNCINTEPGYLYVNNDIEGISPKIIKICIDEDIDNKVPNQSILKKREEKEGIVRNSTYLQKSPCKIRFNNIDDYFVDNNLEYIVFEEKVRICNPFIPRTIKVGMRNKTVFFLLSQYVVLNPFKGMHFLQSIGQTINTKSSSQLSPNELDGIIRNVLKKRKEGALSLYLNEERKILFNPNYKLTRKEKMKIVNEELGKIKNGKTQKKIYEAIEYWNFKKDGEIIQKKVALKTSISLTTIKRHWHLFKEYVIEVSNDFKLNFEENGTA